jgi:hypothetical protein
MRGIEWWICCLSSRGRNEDSIIDVLDGYCEFLIIFSTNLYGCIHRSLVSSFFL